MKENKNTLDECLKRIQEPLKFTERLFNEFGFEIPLISQPFVIFGLTETQYEELFNFIVEEGKSNNRKPTIEDFFTACEKYNEKIHPYWK